MAYESNGFLEDLISELSIENGEKAVKICQEFQNLRSFMNGGKGLTGDLFSKAISNEESEVQAVLVDVFYAIKRPVSVSYMNVLMNMYNKGNIRVDYSFLRKFQLSFSTFVIGDDLKVHFRNQTKRSESNLSSGSHIYIAAFQKDDNAISKILAKLKQTSRNKIEFEEMMKEFSTNKYKLGLSFILRNSHIFELYSEHNKAFVKICSNASERQDVITEANTWKDIEVHGFEKFLAVRLRSVLEKFPHPLLLGTLQCSFCYGHFKVDKVFINDNNSIFEIVKGPAISLVGKDYLELSDESIDGHNLTNKNDRMTDRKIDSSVFNGNKTYVTDVSSDKKDVVNGKDIKESHDKKNINSVLITIRKCANMTPQIFFGSTILSVQEKRDALLDIQQLISEELDKLK